MIAPHSTPYPLVTPPPHSTPFRKPFLATEFLNYTLRLRMWTSTEPGGRTRGLRNSYSNGRIYIYMHVCGVVVFTKPATHPLVYAMNID